MHVVPYTSSRLTPCLHMRSYAWINILSLPIITCSSAPSDAFPDPFDTDADEIHWDIIDSWLDSMNAGTGTGQVANRPSPLPTNAPAMAGVRRDTDPVGGLLIRPLEWVDSGSSTYPDGSVRSTRRLKITHPAAVGKGTAGHAGITGPKGSSPEGSAVGIPTRPYVMRPRAAPAATTPDPTDESLEPRRRQGPRKGSANPMGVDSRIAALRIFARNSTMERKDYYAALSRYGIADVHLHHFRDNEFRLTRQMPWVHEELMRKGHNISDIVELEQMILQKARELVISPPRSPRQAIRVWKRYVIDPLVTNPRAELPYQVDSVMGVFRLNPAQQRQFFLDRIKELEARARGQPPAASPGVSRDATSKSGSASPRRATGKNRV